ncbi:hypothetical protein ACHAXA_009386 [Cyclostephanos tholiformis]|uniref:Uncharacterized protein n=1 Tax=Cyclostephanos tholiformis TaxID=382380 RepID=A0ABD3RGF8_9STRA
MQRISHRQHPLPVTIVVRNFFPPLAPHGRTSSSIIGADIPNDGAYHADDEECEDDVDDVDVATESRHRRPPRHVGTLTTSSVEGRCAMASREVLRATRLDVVVVVGGGDGGGGGRRPQDVDECDDGTDDRDEHDDRRALSSRTEAEVVFSSTRTNPSAHPRWDHVNELLPPQRPRRRGGYDDDGRGGGIICDWRARIVVLDDDDIVLPSGGMDDRDGRDGAGMRSNATILAEVPLDPTRLRRLHRPTRDDVDTNDDAHDEYDEYDDDDDVMAIPPSLPPNSILIRYDDGITRVMPELYRHLVRCGAIRDDDVSTRFDIVVHDDEKNGGSAADPMMRMFRDRRADDGGRGGGSYAIFEDGAFSLLPEAAEEIAEDDDVDDGESGSVDEYDDESATGDDGIANPKTTYDDVDGRAYSRRTSSSNLYDNDKIFDLLGGGCGTAASSSSAAATTAASASVVASDDGRIFDSLGGGDRATVRVDADDVTAAVVPAYDDELSELLGGGESESTTAVNDSSRELIQDGPTAFVKDGISEDKPGSISEKTTAYDDVEIPRADANELSSSSSSTCIVQTIPKEELPSLPQSPPPSEEQAEIEELRRLVRKEQRLLEEEQQRIAQGTIQLRSLMQQVQLIEDETRKAERTISAERVVSINTPVNPPNYPRHQFTIADLPFPDDVHTLVVSDDEISAALGYVCQMVSLTSKYLGIPLRYALICKFSRSAVLYLGRRDGSNDSRTVYPLFRERGVIDREQLDYGLTLLDRNVNCLLRVRQVGFRNDWNLLAKIDRLFAHVVDGE